MMFEEYKDRVGELITGIIQQSDNRYTLVQLRERVEALLPRSEQVYNERYDHGMLQEDGRTCLLVASGTGLAPFMSMIETLRDRGQTRDLMLLHGVSHDYDLAWRERAGGAGGVRMLPAALRGDRLAAAELPGLDGATGRVESIVDAQLDEHRLTPENATIYLCGNPDMIEAVEATAAARGFPPEQVRKELYWPKGREH